MIIINSGAYVIPELQAEFGRIPPCMLPLGNRRLLEHQVVSIRNDFGDTKIILSLPESYIPTAEDRLFFASVDLNVVFVPDKFTLAESVLYVLNAQEDDMPSAMRLMHGDTLIYGLPAEHDIIGVSATMDDYEWELESADDCEEVIWCGYFAFSSSRLLIQSLARSCGNFTDAIRMYSAKRELLLANIEKWHDLGHVNTYFRSRTLITTERAFNSLVIKDGIVKKTGNPNRKIEAEAMWFQHLPADIKKYTPQLIDSGRDTSGLAFYSLEFLPLPALNEIFVHGRNPPFFWRKIFTSFAQLLNEFRDIHQTDSDRKNIAEDVDDFFRKKTLRRLQEFSESSDFDIHSPLNYGGHQVPSLWNLAQICIAKTSCLEVVPAILHGDLCFSNALYDSRSGAIKVIDPRGLTESDKNTIYGDQKYDVAKLAHSVLGLYDYIISGRYELRLLADGGVYLDFHLDERVVTIQRLFEQTVFLPGIAVKEIMPAVVLLFLSMLPLHVDRPDRQQAMIANALRIYLTYCTSESSQ